MKSKSIRSVAGCLAVLLCWQASAQQSASISEKSSRENRSQLEQSINEESSKELQRQQGREDRTGQESRNTDTNSQRKSTEFSTRNQQQSTDRVVVRTAPLALINEVFAYVERGQSATGVTATAIKKCSLVTNPRAPKFPGKEPKTVANSVEGCMILNKEKSIGQCKMELKQAAHSWLTTGMPSTMRISSDHLLSDGACWALYGLVAEAALEELAHGEPLPLGKGIKVGLAKALSKQLHRSDLPIVARKIAQRQFGKNCVVPTSRGYRFEGRYDWSCGAFTADPKTLSASVGELTIYGRGNALFGRSWDLETSHSQDMLYSTSRSFVDSSENSLSNAHYSSSDNRQNQSRNLSMRISERLQTERAANIMNSAETGFSVSQPGMKSN